MSSGAVKEGPGKVRITRDQRPRACAGPTFRSKSRAWARQRGARLRRRAAAAWPIPNGRTVRRAGRSRSASRAGRLRAVPHERTYTPPALPRPGAARPARSTPVARSAAGGRARADVQPMISASLTGRPAPARPPARAPSRRRRASVAAYDLSPVPYERRQIIDDAAQSRSIQAPPNASCAAGRRGPSLRPRASHRQPSRLVLARPAGDRHDRAGRGEPGRDARLSDRLRARSVDRRLGAARGDALVRPAGGRDQTDFRLFLPRHERRSATRTFPSTPLAMRSTSPPSSLRTATSSRSRTAGRARRRSRVSCATSRARPATSSPPCWRPAPTLPLRSHPRRPDAPAKAAGAPAIRTRCPARDRGARARELRRAGAAASCTGSIGTTARAGSAKRMRAAPCRAASRTATCRWRMPGEDGED